MKWLTYVTASVSTLLPHNRPDELSPLRANQKEHVHRCAQYTCAWRDLPLPVLYAEGALNPS